jgi:hypothetical protein
MTTDEKEDPFIKTLTDMVGAKRVTLACRAIFLLGIIGDRPLSNAKAAELVGKYLPNDPKTKKGAKAVGEFGRELDRKLDRSAPRQFTMPKPARRQSND